ncbi:hypothetical protein TrLO_g6804 [Triparma laevis f. longispina]|uniref:Alpha-glucosidase n=1 Tax=Triparma laevis f. longispina TaxID=1714387 RepID=A0A9W7KRS3_9STRA|nr:hypothetical protein TrLO_g6804 [Triparma laevis f. longispina]
MKISLPLLLLLSLLLLTVQGLKYEVDDSKIFPVATSNSFTYGLTRITVLTSNLFRLEESKSGVFEDRPSLAFQGRDQVVEDLQVKEEANVITMTTNSVQLTMDPNLGLPSILITSISPKSAFSTWKFGDSNKNQLPGTIRTLDQTGPISLYCDDIVDIDPPQGESYHCTMGLFSSSGDAVSVDDVDTPLVDPVTGFWSEEGSADSVDTYVFTHGLDFKQALADYKRVGGAMPIPPRHSLGIWFTRWINYNGFDVDNIVKEYAERSLPLDIFVLDMNWHKKNDWTGYTFDDRLFPYGGGEVINPLKDKLGIKFGANIHDDDGIGFFEKSYEAMASAVNFDTSNNDTVPFMSCSSPDYAYALEDAVLQPLEKEDGIGFWWIDWQQGPTEGGCLGDKYNPTIQLSKLRITDNIRRGEEERSMILARWGGLGNHRYQVGFSGDVDQVTWDRLAYQPYFSATAANVGFGLWSHDLVGPNKEDTELFLRWLQWGAFSSIFRTHDRGMSSGGCADNDSGCNLLHIWDLPQPQFQIARDFLQLRSSLMPYIYSATRTMHDSLLSFLRPMYLDFPAESDAYDACAPDGSMSQFMFGDDMFVAPVVNPADETTNLATKTVWVPPGKWVDVNLGTVMEGPANVDVTASLAETPRFVKQSSVISSKPLTTGAQFATANDPFSNLIFNVYPSSTGASSGSAHVYEDDGQTNAYFNSNDYVKLDFKYDISDEGEISAKLDTTGSYDGAPSTRNVMVKVWNCPFIASSNVHYNANELSCTFSLDESSDIKFTFGSDLSGIKGIISRANAAKSLLDEAQEAPGSMTGGQVHSAYLTKVASLGSILSHAIGVNDFSIFDDAVANAWDLLDLAKSEIDDLKKEKEDDEGSSDATINRIVQARALLEF